MPDTTAPIAIDAGELTLLVGDRPDVRAYQANPLDLADRDQAQRTLNELRDEGVTVLVGVEFDDPAEPGNHIVLAGAELVTVEFVDADSATIPVDTVLDRLTSLAYVLTTKAP